MRINIDPKSLDVSTDEDSTTVYVDGLNGNLYCMDLNNDSHHTRAEALVYILKMLCTIDIDAGWKKL